MKTIRLSANNRRMLKSSGKSYDDMLEDLLDKTEEYMPFVAYDDVMSNPFKISDDNYDRLKALAISNTESIDNIITRLLIIVNELD